jgi:hypothetical protein
MEDQITEEISLEESVQEGALETEPGLSFF